MKFPDTIALIIGVVIGTYIINNIDGSRKQNRECQFLTEEKWEEFFGKATPLNQTLVFTTLVSQCLDDDDVTSIFVPRDVQSFHDYAKNFKNHK